MKTAILTSLNKFPKILPLINRIILASMGSYAIATLTALACLALPIDRISAIYWGYIASAVVCTMMIMLAFSIRNLCKAWAITCIIASIMGGIWYFGTPKIF